MTRAMGDAAHNVQNTERYNQGYDAPDSEGWLFFSGTILGLAGIMRIIDSIWAFRYKGALPSGLKDGLVGDNLKNYAWLWLGVGIVLLLASFAVLAKSQLARWIGLFAAAVGGLTAMAWIPYYPIWSLVYITLSVLVFYGLAVHGGREAAA